MLFKDEIDDTDQSAAVEPFVQDSNGDNEETENN